MSIKNIDVSSRQMTCLTGVPSGFDAHILKELALLKWNEDRNEGPVQLVHISLDEQRLSSLASHLLFFAPDLDVLQLSGWDCLPYDRISPSCAISGHRMVTLGRLVPRSGIANSPQTPKILLTTINAAVQRLPSRKLVFSGVKCLLPGQEINMKELIDWLNGHGYERVSTVSYPGHFAPRGGILDLFSPNEENPVRLDFFGNRLESIRTFDAERQCTISRLSRLEIIPMSEVNLNEEGIERFRSGYREIFKVAGRDERLYDAVSAGHRSPGIEHWLPLFYENMETLFNYLGHVIVTFEEETEAAITARFKQITDHYQARLDHKARDLWSQPYRPLPPHTLYLDQKEWKRILSDHPKFCLSSSEIPVRPGLPFINMGATCGQPFTIERLSRKTSLFEAVASRIRKIIEAREKKIAIACRSQMSRDRMSDFLVEYKFENIKIVENWPQMKDLPIGPVYLVIIDLKTGFESEDIVFITEQDIFGEHRPYLEKRSKKSIDFLKDVSVLSSGDLVVHIDHGIGRFEGLYEINAAGARHDCLALLYAEGGKLYLPVENIELLSRYGSDMADVPLDKLGNVAWQTRRTRLKERIHKMAGELIKVAAARKLLTATPLIPPDGLFKEFCARFSFEETEDQKTAIDAVLDDLSSGRPMDRLICGDVGFGKTEIAVRSAFVAAMAGCQIAVIVPTTLLARQHFQTFSERFSGLPIKIGQMTRFTNLKDMSTLKKDMKDGTVDIVIGTHGLLGKSVVFHNLGLVIIDEEQHFGVVHKERLKQFRSDLHILTLTATPIPRTLQLALSGIRELSIIATPPQGRLSVQTFLTPFDPVTLREALLREQSRGGQTLYVCPRIADIKEVEEFLSGYVPEVSVTVAHSHVSANDLENRMIAFYEGRFDVLLSTTIIESGLDISTANTLIVHRADMFGLAQLYQIRGRVGRSRTRACAILTLPPGHRPSAVAEKRLKALQCLDTPGAGFMLASHDLDIRGAGNLLGEEQS
ncbi:MAG: transcription-repair coupling factor, partial [Alphaproteobacteria bacterium]|nr:transcription-repair coupling factor [Alphaproteobacteria bacterium]